MITAMEAKTLVSGSSRVKAEVLEEISKHIRSAALEGLISITFARREHPQITQSVIDSLRKHGFSVEHKPFDHTLPEVFVELKIHW